MTVAAVKTEQPEVAAAAAQSTSRTAPDKRPEVEALLAGILERMAYPAKLEFKDMPDGGLGVAVHFDGELPGITPNKRSYLVDCIQFLVNKVVNRPNVEKRWVTLGVNAFPEPRAPKNEGAPAASAPPAPAPKASEPKPSAPKAAQAQGAKKNGAPVAAVVTPGAGAAAVNKKHDANEAGMAVDPSPMMTRLGTTLAEKAAKHGRFYAVTLLGLEDRARVLKAGSAVKGQTTKVEGEGHFRRVAFVPDKPVAIAKKQVMPDFDDEE